MTSRERFEAWAKALPFPIYFDCVTGTDGVPCYAASNTQLAWEAWQAAEREAVRWCVEWIDAFSIAGDMSKHMKYGIKGAFSESFK